MGKRTAIVLSAGSGKRMNSDTKKQYLLIKDKPIIYYSLNTFQQSSIIDEIILVASADDMDYVRSEIVAKYGFTKVSNIVVGGKERYNSVYNGLKCCNDSEYVFIHDGARPFITEEILVRAMKVLSECGSAVVGMPVKDTIKIVNDDLEVTDTPNRKTVWQVQTPQCFKANIAISAYEKLILEENSGELKNRGIQVTDDAMVVETFYESDGGKFKGVRLVEGSYENIKITTPEDLKIAEVFFQ
ncbi:MAG: 2-C-methyl-D-erythritol 4-phosphate cytidylyltransferase [Lachnospiraceae bacterium]|nr:2-C-methyl-D-erythritol 4-phosphate cytidylyltransferase [Lachnospiraceae bacterium]